MTQAGSPDPGTTVSAFTSSCPRQLVYSRCQHQLRFSVPFATNHDRPGHASDLVGECNRSHLCWSAIYYSGQPSALGAVLARVANDRPRTRTFSLRMCPEC